MKGNNSKDNQNNDSKEEIVPTKPLPIPQSTNYPPQKSEDS